VRTRAHRAAVRAGRARVRRRPLRAGAPGGGGPRTVGRFFWAFPGMWPGRHGAGLPCRSGEGFQRSRRSLSHPAKCQRERGHSHSARNVAPMHHPTHRSRVAVVDAHGPKRCSGFPMRPSSSALHPWHTACDVMEVRPRGRHCTSGAGFASSRATSRDPGVPARSTSSVEKRPPCPNNGPASKDAGPPVLGRASALFLSLRPDV